MPPRRRQPAGLTLLELLLVIAVMGILVGLVLPSSEPNTYDQLRSVTRIVTTDLAYGRSLALANNSTYRFTFDTQQNRYVLEHSGGNAALDRLPDSPFRSADDPPDRHIVDLDDLPHLATTVRLLTAAGFQPGLQRVKDLEFGPLGETTRSGETLICLAAGSESETRYVWLCVNPVTGLAEVWWYTSQPPPPWLLN